ncbi:eukaryotic translation initiation factor 4 gamma 3-like isoform X2 [Tachypleus tridentatus]|uniref:eukaryotic translation initiation factor 4 gamma 3-like isoform X2 n=1 Tax=Tachypleus tridentatus TaxID=6853 RepID=UPI003FD451D7
MNLQKGKYHNSPNISIQHQTSRGTCSNIHICGPAPQQFGRTEEYITQVPYLQQNQRLHQIPSGVAQHVSSGAPHDMSKPGPLQGQGGPPALQYLSGAGPHQPQAGMPAPMTADNIGPQFQPSGLHQHHGHIHRQQAGIGQFYQIPQHISNMPRSTINQMNATPLTADSSASQFPHQLSLVYQQGHSFPGQIPPQTSMLFQGGVHTPYQRLQPYSTTPQYNAPPTQQTVFVTPPTQPYAYSQQMQFSLSPANMATAPNTLSPMVHSGAGTTERRERKILSVVDPYTGHDIMQDIISHSSLKENDSPMNEIAAQFARQVAALATSSKEDSTSKEENLDFGEAETSVSVFQQNSSVEEKVISGVIEMRSSAANMDNNPEMHNPGVCHAVNASVLYGSEITADTFGATSEVGSCEAYVQEDYLADITEVSNFQSKVNLEGSNKNIRFSEVDRSSINIHASVNPSLFNIDDGLETSVVGFTDFVRGTDFVVPSGVEQSEMTVEKQNKCQKEKHILDIFKPEEEKVKISENIELKQNGEVNERNISEVGKDMKENKKPRRQRRMKELNRKGENKEGGEMDAFLDKKQIPTPRSLSPSSEKSLLDVSPQPPASPVRLLQDDLTEDNYTKEKFTENNIMNLRELGENQVIDENMDDKKDEKSENDLGDEDHPSQEQFTDKNQFNYQKPSYENQVIENNVVNESVSNEEPETVEELPVFTDLLEPQIKLKFYYPADQWSPLNLEGKKQYDRDFLLQLQSEPVSLKKPQGLPDLEVIKDKAIPFKHVDIRRTLNQGQFRSNHSDPFMPLYADGAQQRNNQGGIRGKRHSQQSKDKGKKIFTSSFSKDVKLHASENAWKPSRKAEEPDSHEEKNTQELYRKVQGILNRLTPQKFETLVNQVKELPIDNKERLMGVMNLVFKKAVEEPNFSVPYANMCKTLAMMQVPADDGSNQCVKFSKLLLTKCQQEFEKDINDEINKEGRLKQIEEAETAEKKCQLQEELEEEEVKAKKRSLGNIRFVGELFKLGMLTTPIMHTCIKKLLGQGDEDSLECLCHLLTTIGKELEREKNKQSGGTSMNSCFETMKTIVKERKTNSRIRFMLQDVIELRQNNWVPRREDNNPKTIDQIHWEAEKEAQEKQLLLLQVHVTPQKRSDERERRKSRNNLPFSDEGWNTVTSRSKIDTSKLKQFAKGGQAEVENIQLGPGCSFYSWGKGSSGGTKTQSQETESRSPLPSNRFSALSTTEQNHDSRRGTQRSAASSRESSQTCGAPVVRKTPSQLLAKYQENTTVAVICSYPGGGEGFLESKPVSQDEKEITEEPKMLLKGKDMSEEEMETRTKELIDEFLHNCDFKEATHCFVELTSPTTVSYFISAAINHVLERSSQARILVGQFLHDLVQNNVIPGELYIKGLKSILENADDYAIDIPRIWEYLGELIGPMIQDGSIPLSLLKEAVEPCVASGTAGKLLTAVLHAAAGKLCSIKTGELWKKSGLQWTECLSPKQNVEKFIEENNLQFTVSETEPLPDAQLSTEQIKQKLDFLLQKQKACNKEIFDWIEIHVEKERCKSSQFIRALTTALVESAIEGEGNNCRFNSSAVSDRLSILKKYLDNKENLELEALYGLQALVNRLQHPKRLLLDVFNIFYDLDIISDEAYIRWEQSSDPAEQEGRGVALKSVVSFFTWLKEVEDESADSD